MIGQHLPLTWQQSLALFVASMLAGGVNSVAGGGTLLTFPALIALGQTALIANATSTVALWPGQLSSLWGYRKEIGQTRAVIVPLSVVGTLGGIVGAWLLLITPASTFDKLVPFLVLLATALFMAQEPLARRNRARLARQASASQAGDARTADIETQQTAPPENSGAPSASAPASSAFPSLVSTPPVTSPAAPTADTKAPDAFRRPTIAIALLAFGIAIYGGYFGAGIGILTLAALGFLGFTNIHQMNGVKNIFTLCINGIAALIFVFKGLVDWRVAALMAGGAIFGGYAGAGVARRIGQQNVRRLIIGLGFVLTLSLLFRANRPPEAANHASILDSSGSSASSPIATPARPALSPGKFAP